MLKRIFLFLVIASLGYGAPEVTLDELKSVRPNSAVPAPKPAPQNEISIEELKRIAPTDESNLNVDDSELKDEVKVTELLLSTTKVPRNAYVNQIYKIDLKADIQQDIAVDINLTMPEITPNMKWLNADSYSWLETSPGVFETRLWFEANSTGARVGNLKVVMNRNGEFFQKAVRRAPTPDFIDVPAKENYSHIVADELKILSHKSTQFDDDSVMMTIQLGAKNGNLGSFYIDNDKIIRQSVSSVSGDFDNQKGFAFLIIDNNTTNVAFNYFNLQTKTFENFSLNVKVEKDDLSTQTDINPKNDAFKIYKQIAVFAFVALLVVMFLTSRNFTPLIIAVLVLGAYFYLQKPISKGTISANTQMRILPLKNSTIFEITKSEQKVEIFGENGDYAKVVLDNGKIGWVEKSKISQ